MPSKPDAFRIPAASKRDANVTRMRVRVLSDLLRAELGGAPVDYARYCAKYPKRTAVLDSLIMDRLIQTNSGGAPMLTFQGLVSLATRDATALLTDCRRVYNVLRAHFKREVHAPLSIDDIAKRIRPERPIARVVLAVSMLKREGGANLGGAGGALDASSKINGNQQLLEKSFAGRIKDLRGVLARARFEDGAHVTQLQRSEFPWPTSIGDESHAAIVEFGSDEVREAWKKCLERESSDFGGAITSAKTLVESVCKQILDGRGVQFSPAASLPDLYSKVRQQIDLDPAREASKASRSVLQGCVSVVNGLAELRNAYGDSHGKEPGAGRPAKRHAHLAVAAAGAIAGFLLATDEGRKSP